MSKQRDAWTWMPLMVQRWLLSRSVRRMSLAARGLYTDLLCHQWIDGSIPADVEDIAAMTQARVSEVRQAWTEVESHFPLSGPQTRQNIELESIRTEQQALSDKRSQAAKSGNAKRWSKPEPELLNLVPGGVTDFDFCDHKTIEFAITNEDVLRSQNDVVCDPNKEKKRKENTTTLKAKEKTPTKKNPSGEITGPYGIAHRVINAARAELGLDAAIDADLRRELRPSSAVQQLVVKYGENVASAMFVYAWRNWDNGATWASVLNQRDRITAALNGERPGGSKLRNEADEMLNAMRGVGHAS